MNHFGGQFDGSSVSALFSQKMSWLFVNEYYTTTYTIQVADDENVAKGLSLKTASAVKSLTFAIINGHNQ